MFTLLDSMQSRKQALASNMEKIEKSAKIYLLNLPDSTLDDILKRLSPIELVKMSEVCTFLRDICRSDHLWEKHIKQKWGRVFGDVAFKEWQWHITLTTAKEEGSPLNQQINNQNGSLGSFSGVWPMLCLGSYLQDCEPIKSSFSNNFMMALYFSLENGKFWFPAQLYRGLYVSNALVSYDSKTDAFQARKQSVNWRILGSNIKWDKLRPSPVETSSCDRHVSDCFQELKPGDHIEIQWRGNRKIPYVAASPLQISPTWFADWWYAVIGHLDSCNENENYCRCYDSETLVVEFKQYRRGSSMRRTKLPRHNNGELDENSFGLYGGIRKLHSEEEIEKWKDLLVHTLYI